MANEHEKYYALCMRIREHCIVHGPDGQDGAIYWPGSEAELIDGRGRRLWRTLPEPRSPFIYPRATEYQLQATEAALGFPLPPLLRMIYAEVANGGFGPGSGITGAKGGYCVNEDGRYDTIDWCTDTDQVLNYVALNTLDIGPDGDPFTVDLPFGSYPQWPIRVLHLAYDGCSCDFWLDVATGHIYYGQPNQVEMPDESLRRITGDPNATSLEPTIHLERVAPSLEIWLEAWLRGDHQGVYGPMPTTQDGDTPW